MLPSSPIRWIFIGIFSLLSLPTAWAQPEGLTAKELYQEGKELYYDGDYEAAQTIFLQALELANEPDEMRLDILFRLAKNARRLRTHQKALDYLGQSLELWQNMEDADPEYEAEIRFEFGNVYSQMYQPEEANRYYQQCLVLYQKFFGTEHSKVGNMYMNFGISAQKMGRYNDAEKYYLKARSVFEKSSEPTSEDFNRIFSNLGYLYRKMGDYDRAIEYGEKALEIKLLNYKPTHPSVPKYYRNIGRAYQEKGLYNKALPYMEKTAQLLEQSLGREHPQTGGSFGELGSLYADLKQYEKALDYYDRAKSIMEARMEPTHPYLVGGYFNIGRVYEMQGKYEEARALYGEVLTKFEEAPYAPPALIAQTERRLAVLYGKQQDWKKALEVIKKAMQLLVEDGAGLDGVNSPLNYLELLGSKADFLEQGYKATNDLSLLKESFSTHQQTIRLIEFLRKSYYSEDARILLAERTIFAFDKGVRQGFDLYDETGDENYLEAAFLISEQSKANVLWQQLRSEYALQSSGIPQSVLDEIATLEHRIGRVDEAEEGSVKILRDLELDYQRSIQKLEELNPRYYNLKYGAAAPDIAAIQARLPNNQSAFLEYYYDGETVYGFLLKKDGLSTFQQTPELDIKAAIQRIRDPEATGGLVDQEAINGYAQSLFSLYQVLLQPIQQDLEDIKRLVIVPHGLLHHLSFEMLAPAQSEIDFRRFNYLIKTKKIQYAWSGNFYVSASLAGEKADEAFLGFAPDFGGDRDAVAYRRDLAPLPFAGVEVDQAGKLFSGQVFTGQEATEAAFMEWANKARIVHLATHAWADEVQPERSGLAFAIGQDSLEDGVLGLDEIYNLNLNADLAVMSACNTGIGKLAGGEGVMSLGRAFSYAGCKSVVMSLWLTNDRSSAQIMKGFYGYLEDGWTKDAALQQAKLDYLEEADALTAHPYFWGNLIAVGDMEAMKTGGRPWWVWGIVLIGIFGLFFLFSFFRKGQS